MTQISPLHHCREGGGGGGGVVVSSHTQIVYIAFFDKLMSSFQFYTLWNVGPDIHYRQICGEIQH